MRAECIMQSEDNDFNENKSYSRETDTLPANIKQSIDDVVKKEDYQTYNISHRVISTRGGNFMGILREVDVKGKTKDGDQEINIFVKQAVSDDLIKFVSVPDCYYRESYFYNELMKIYEELQENANVPEKERFRVVKSFSGTNTKAIILENVSKKGFMTLDRMDVAPLTFAELSIKELVKFHGLSMVLQQQRPEYFDRKLRSLEKPFDFDDDKKSFADQICLMACHELTYDSRKRVEKVIEDFVERFKKHWNAPRVGSCLCHGDYKINNLMYREVDGEITELITIDFQVLHYGCPLNDLVFFMFTGSDREFRRKHMDNLKNLYYETLQSFLQYFDIDLKLLYPRKEFERKFRETLEYGLLISMFTLPYIFQFESDVQRLDKTNSNEAVFKMDSRFKKRMQDIVDDFIQWGYI